MKISLITPTGDRPEAFSLCERWMSRQTLSWDQWIVVDDGFQPTTPSLGQTYIRRTPAPDRHTLSENLLAAMPLVEGDLLFVVEDDDWYGENWLQHKTEDFVVSGCSVVGNRHIYTYSITGRAYKHADQQKVRRNPLANTGMLRSKVSAFATIVQNRVGKTHQDILLWDSTPDACLVDRATPPQFLSVKQVPGRKGRTASQRLGGSPTGFDPDGSWLRKFIGVSDYNNMMEAYGA